jgi:hypothetical protein
VVFKDGGFLGAFALPVGRPYALTACGDRVLIASKTLHHEGGGIHIYGRDKTYLSTVSPAIDYTNGVYDTLWNKADLRGLGDGRVLVGWQFLNRLALIDCEGRTELVRSMDAFYEPFESQTKRGIMPDGYTATGFSEGPEDTFFVSVCDNEKRSCRLIYRFSADLTKAVGRAFLDHHIWRLRYLEASGQLGILNSENQILFFPILD